MSQRGPSPGPKQRQILSSPIGKRTHNISAHPYSQARSSRTNETTNQRDPFMFFMDDSDRNILLDNQKLQSIVGIPEVRIRSSSVGRERPKKETNNFFMDESDAPASNAVHDAHKSSPFAIPNKALHIKKEEQPKLQTNPPKTSKPPPKEITETKAGLLTGTEVQPGPVITSKDLRTNVTKKPIQKLATASTISPSPPPPPPSSPQLPPSVPRVVQTASIKQEPNQIPKTTIPHATTSTTTTTTNTNTLKNPPKLNIKNEKHTQNNPIVPNDSVGHGMVATSVQSKTLPQDKKVAPSNGIERHNTDSNRPISQTKKSNTQNNPIVPHDNIASTPVVTKRVPSKPNPIPKSVNTSALEISTTDLKGRIKEWEASHNPREEVPTNATIIGEYNHGVTEFVNAYTKEMERATQNPSQSGTVRVGETFMECDALDMESDSDSDVDTRRKKEARKARKNKLEVIKSLKRRVSSKDTARNEKNMGAMPLIPEVPGEHLPEPVTQIREDSVTLDNNVPAPILIGTQKSAKVIAKSFREASQQYESAVEDAANASMNTGDRKILGEKLDKVMIKQQKFDSFKPLPKQQMYYPVEGAIRDVSKKVLTHLPAEISTNPTSRDEIMKTFTGMVQSGSMYRSDMSLIQTFIREYCPKLAIPNDRMQVMEHVKEDTPYRTRGVEEQYLREYKKGQERPCISGDMCEGMFIGEHKVILPEVLGMADMIGVITDDRSKLPEAGGPCVMCGRMWMAYAWSTARGECTNIKGKWRMQKYYNIEGAPGEYAIEDCITSSKDSYQGLALPVVLHTRHRYTQEVVDGLVWFRQTGYIKPTGSVVNPEPTARRVFQ
jgi:hypothetical protein